MLKFAIFVLIFSSIGLICNQVIPLCLERFHRIQEKKVSETEKKLDKMFIQVRKEKLLFFYTLTPVAAGLFAFLFFNNLVFLFIGVVAGSILPTIVIKKLEALRKARFQAQLVDAVMIISSSLRGGLSFLQAIEVLVEQMPSPISQEFGLIVRENKMGITLDESLRRLSERMNINELSLMINSILVARETGGDLTKVLARLTNTIRDNQKLKDNIKTLTLQGRLQGIIMPMLPFVFVPLVLTFNRYHFDIMLQTETGRMLLILAVILQVLGIFLIHKFSTINIERI